MGSEKANKPPTTKDAPEGFEDGGEFLESKEKRNESKQSQTASGADGGPS